jgi:hypothetical protein
MASKREFYELFYLWIIAPNRFFLQLLKRYKDKNNVDQILFLGLSFLLPILGGTLLFSFLSRFAFIQIADKILPKGLIWLIIVLLTMLLNLTTLLLIPGFTLTYQLKKQNIGTINIFDRISILRNNFFQIPILVVLIIANLTSFRRTWKIYNLGIYLAMLMILIYVYVTIFQVSSLPSISVQLPSSSKRKRIIPYYQYGLKAILSTALFTGFCFLLDIGLTSYLGAVNMSLWHKLAMFFLHVT